MNKSKLEYIWLDGYKPSCRNTPDLDRSMQPAFWPPVPGPEYGRDSRYATAGQPAPSAPQPKPGANVPACSQQSRWHNQDIGCHLRSRASCLRREQRPDLPVHMFSSPPSRLKMRLLRLSWSVMPRLCRYRSGGL